MDEDHPAPPEEDEDLAYLVRVGFVERRRGPDGRWWYRLTAAGHLRATYDQAKDARNWTVGKLRRPDVQTGAHRIWDPAKTWGNLRERRSCRQAVGACWMRFSRRGRPV